MHSHEVVERLRAFEVACHAHGLPVTAQRRVVYESLMGTDRHPTAEQLWEVAREELPELSRTTVYRVLETLVAAGLALRVPTPGAVAHFDANVVPHHHAYCTRCACVFDAAAFDGEPPVRPHGLPSGFRVESCAVLFLGICADCRAAGPSKAGHAPS